MSTTRRVLASCLGAILALLLAVVAPTDHQAVPSTQFQLVARTSPVTEAPVITTTPSPTADIMSALQNAVTATVPETPPAPETPEPPAPADCLHTVPAGGSLSKSALAIGNGMTTSRLHTLNSQIGQNPDLVRAGQVLRCDEDTAIPAAIAPVSTTPDEPSTPANQTTTDASTSSNRVRIWDRLAECESGSNWSINTGNGYYGGVQFSQESWRYVGGTGRPDQASKDVQIEMAERLLIKQGWKNAWPDCSLKQGLRNEPTRDEIQTPAVQVPVTEVAAAAAPANSSNGWVHPFPAMTHCSSGYRSADRPNHGGVDMSNRRIGSPILAVASGIVRKAGSASGYGQVVVIEHDGGIHTEYGHVVPDSITVQAGQRVAAGEQIAQVGNEGRSTGPHLHFEVTNGFFGNEVNPSAFMAERDVALCG